MPQELRNVTVAGFMDENQRAWDEEVIRDICNERDSTLICQIPIPNTSRGDSWFWLPDERGEFTVRSCYRQLQGEHEYAESNFWRKLWGLNLSGKVTNFLWRACYSCLPTADALRSKHVNVSMECTWCHTHAETAVHVLFQCKFAHEVWLCTGFQSDLTVLNQDTVKTVLQRMFGTRNKEQCAVLGLLCWGLWYRRNQWVWNRINQSVFSMKAMALNLFNDWKTMKTATTRDRERQQIGDRIWTKPPTDWIKINVDAACNQHSGFVGLGCVIRNADGSFLRDRSNVIAGTMHPRMAEALSLREALQWTKQWRGYRCIFECDCKTLVEAVNGSIGYSYFDTIVTDCKELIKHFEEVLVVFVHRSANTVAHLLARATYSTSGLRE